MAKNSICIKKKPPIEGGTVNSWLSDTFVFIFEIGFDIIFL